MTIELKLKQQEVILVNNNLQNASLQVPINKDWEAKMAHSIVLDLSDKFQKKVKTQIKKANLFDTNKLIKTSLKYHEAWALYYTLQDWVLNQSCHRDEIRVQNIINTLNQKLL